MRHLSLPVEQPSMHVCTLYKNTRVERGKLMEQTKWAVSEEEFKLAEKMIREYHTNKRLLDKLVNDIRLATPTFDDNGGGRSNIPSNPTERIVITVLNDARIQYLDMWVTAVEKIFRELDADKQRFVRMAYWENNSRISWKEQALRCNLTYPTMNRWRKAIVLRLCQIAGAR